MRSIKNESRLIVLRHFSGIAGALCLAMLVFVLFSAFFTAYETDHHCHCEDDDCPICEYFAVCEGVLREISDGLASLVVAACIFTAAYIHFSLRECNIIFGTPVSNKIRLNN